MDAIQRQLMAARGEVMTRAEALAMGLDDNDLSRSVRAGDLIRLDRGVYATPTAALTPVQEHARRARGVLRARPGCVAAARSALALAALPLVGADLTTVLLCAAGRERYHRTGVVTYPLPMGETVSEFGGTGCVSLETAIFQCVARDGLRTAIVAADAALHRGLVTLESLEARRVELRRLAPRGRALLSAVDSRSESPGESLQRLLFIALGYRVETQVVITTPDGEFVGRVDALLEGVVIAEFDGAVKYDGVQGRAALIREKRREDALRALGYVVIRITWADLFTPGRLDEMVRAALRLARRAAPAAS